MTFRKPGDFVLFLKSELSLHAVYMSTCEIFCLTNILGVPVHQLNHDLTDGSDPKEYFRWDYFDPHPSLMHRNKFNTNMEPLFILTEDKINFWRIAPDSV